MVNCVLKTKIQTMKICMIKERIARLELKKKKLMNEQYNDLVQTMVKDGLVDQDDPRVKEAEIGVF